MTNREQKQIWLDGVEEGMLNLAVRGLEHGLAISTSLPAFCATLLTAAVEHPEWAKAWADVFNVHPGNVERLVRTLPITREG